MSPKIKLLRVHLKYLVQLFSPLFLFVCFFFKFRVIQVVAHLLGLGLLIEMITLEHWLIG